MLTEGLWPLRFWEGWHQLGAVEAMYAVFPLPTERAVGVEGQGFSSRKEAETGNRGPVIETICFNKDRLLVEKRRGWPALHPLPEVQSICNLIVRTTVLRY